MKYVQNYQVQHQYARWYLKFHKGLISLEKLEELTMRDKENQICLSFEEER